MANPTTYFGWVMPSATDLVTDLPADFNVFGQGVDTSMQDLLGGTTGQVLSKTSATNMDFTWITPQVGDITEVAAGTGISGGGSSGSVTVTNSMATAIDAKGDLIGGTGADAFSRLAVGANDTVLTADSAQATGLKWATLSPSGLTLITRSTFTTSSAVNVNSVFSATYENYLILFKVTACSVANATTNIRLRVSSTDNTTSNYHTGAFEVNASTTVNRSSDATSGFYFGGGSDIDKNYTFTATMYSPFKSENTTFTAQSFNTATGGITARSLFGGGLFNATTSFDGFSVIPGSGTITGVVAVYGYKI